MCKPKYHKEVIIVTYILIKVLYSFLLIIFAYNTCAIIPEINTTDCTCTLS